MYTSLLKIFALHVLYAFLVASQFSDKQSSNPCLSKETCGQCITAASDCAWCTEEGYTLDGSRRCDVISSIARKCNKTEIIFPGSDFNRTLDKELSNKGTKEGAVQIKPQRITLKLKPNTPFQLTVDFRQAEDYPVDLYYLMDLSKSMEDDKDKLALLGDLLAEKMENITSDFKLGFGSFVDKVVMPYVSTVPEKLLEPCTGCAAPYGFFNQMPLDLNTKKFATKVNEAKVSGNLDAPEGGFDAIMQAIVCQDKIGWREKSRKMLVFSSDSGFHYAGDGKLGGIVKPNDGQCHLNKQGYYTESTQQDYPSLSQLNQKIQDHKVIVIFAITANQLNIYERLSGQLEGSSTGKLENDSSNVVDLVKEAYDKITSGVELRDNATSDVKITYFSTCLDGKKEKRNSCKGLKVGTNVTFEAQIEITSCPKDPKLRNQTIQIYPVGLNEALIIDLQMICECECEKPWREDKGSDKCSGGNGTYECGICSCYNNRYGRECECDSKDTNQAIDEAACYYGNSTKPCSDRGICRCGVCDCFSRINPTEKISGTFCECDNFSCDRYEGKICNGEAHGTCECGVCKCKPGWTGTACDCRDTNDTCVASNGKICSGHGNCECGICRCIDTEEERYSGALCEDCPTCPGKCDLYKDCVQCQMFQTGVLTEEQCKNCSFMPVRVEKIEQEEDNEKICIFRDESDDCKFIFKYKLVDLKNEQIIFAQITKDCPEGVNILAIVLGVILGIVAIGLALLLIWKLLTTIHDRREFAKFEKERQMAKWDTGENPIYKQATSKFINPTFVEGQKNSKNAKIVSTGNSCSSRETCRECIEADAKCAWCSEDSESMTGKGITQRCDQEENLHNCDLNHLVFPKSILTPILSESLDKKVGTEEAIQLQPQHIKLKLRPNSPFLFRVLFRQAKDYPLDLYYLMDLSHSMEDDKKNLSLLGALLAKTMANLTSNFRLGFGSFVDKKVMPYVSTVPNKLINPCSKGNCAPPYGFRNEMSLNQDTRLFSKAVNDAKISGNVDTPEGGFDGIMQAIVCEKEIGWRPKARKIIVVSTDSIFHQAGDGLLGGIVKPNDEKCHLDSQGNYTESVHQDYPSISQLNRKIRENKINTIFAVTTSVIGLYDELSKLVEGSSAGELDNNSSNVVNLVKDQYNKITSSVELKDNATNDMIIDYYSECLDGKKERRSICDGLKVGKTVSFDVEVTVPSCPRDRKDWKQTVQIYPVGVNENLLVDIELDCECDCEKPENEERNSDRCSNSTYECGICSCDSNRYGRQCECSLSQSSLLKNEEMCIKPGANVLHCSGRGVCVCGVCECNIRSKPNEQVYGQFCECDNFSCERVDGVLCNGPDKGKCECGQCVCKNGWIGPSCDCPATNEPCTGPDGKICSDHGNCLCGACRCNDADGQRYTGYFCEECSTCPKQCDFYKDCVQCLMYKTGKYSDPDECARRCQNVKNHLVTADQVDVANGNERRCRHKDESDDCLFDFKYSHEEGHDPVIVVQLTKDCPKGPDVLAIVFGVTGGTVLIGALLLLVWKIFTTIHDKKEYAKFEQESKKAQWNQDENPLYKPSTSEFQNPTFKS